jgi:hypothetical protein
MAALVPGSTSTSRLREGLNRRENRRCSDEPGLEGRDATDGNHNSTNNLPVEAAKGVSLPTLDGIRGCPSKITSTGGGFRVLVFVHVSLLRVVTNCYVAYLASARDLRVTY